MTHDYRITVEWEVATSSEDAENLSDDMTVSNMTAQQAMTEAKGFVDALGVDPTQVVIERMR